MRSFSPSSHGTKLRVLLLRVGFSISPSTATRQPEVSPGPQIGVFLRARY